MNDDFNKNPIPESGPVEFIIRLIADVIIFGVPFGIGILVGHFLW